MTTTLTTLHEANRLVLVRPAEVPAVGPRLVALAVDQLLVVAGCLVATAVWTVFGGSGRGLLAVWLLTCLLVETGQAFAEAVSGATLGGAFAHVRTVSARTGWPAGLVAVVLRRLVLAAGGVVLPVLGAYVVAGSGEWNHSPARRGWHDWAGDTLVLHDWAVPNQDERAAERACRRAARLTGTSVHGADLATPGTRATVDPGTSGTAISGDPAPDSADQVATGTPVLGHRGVSGTRTSGELVPDEADLVAAGTLVLGDGGVSGTGPSCDSVPDEADLVVTGIPVLGDGGVSGTRGSGELAPDGSDLAATGTPVLGDRAASRASGGLAPDRSGADLATPGTESSARLATPGMGTSADLATPRPETCADGPTSEAGVELSTPASEGLADVPTPVDDDQPLDHRTDTTVDVRPAASEPGAGSGSSDEPALGLTSVVPIVVPDLRPEPEPEFPRARHRATTLGLGRPRPYTPTGRHRVPEIPTQRTSPRVVGDWPQMGGPTCAAGAGLRLVFDSGACVEVVGSGAVGRDLSAVQPPPLHPVVVDDPKRTVSRVHLRFGLGPGPEALWVMDENSTNGTILVGPDGGARVVPAGVPTAVGPGWQIRFGERSATVECSTSRTAAPSTDPVERVSRLLASDEPMGVFSPGLDREPVMPSSYRSSFALSEASNVASE